MVLYVKDKRVLLVSLNHFPFSLDLESVSHSDDEFIISFTFNDTIYSSAGMLFVNKKVSYKEFHRHVCFDTTTL